MHAALPAQVDKNAEQFFSNSPVVWFRASNDFRILNFTKQSKLACSLIPELRHAVTWSANAHSVSGTTGAAGCLKLGPQKQKLHRKAKDKRGECLLERARDLSAAMTRAELELTM